MARFSAAKPRVVLRPLRRGPGERQHVGDHGQYRDVFLREQRREIAVAGVDQQREEILLLEIEVMRNVKLEVAYERRREACEPRIACGVRAGERALQTAEEIERSAVLGVERLVGLTLEFHGGPYNGITVPNYRNVVPQSIDPHQAKHTPRAPAR